MKKRMAAVGLTVGLAGGGVAGVVFTGNSPIAIAQDGGASSTVPADGTANGNTATNPAPDRIVARSWPRRSSRSSTTTRSPRPRPTR